MTKSKKFIFVYRYSLNSDAFRTLDPNFRAFLSNRVGKVFETKKAFLEAISQLSDDLKEEFTEKCKYCHAVYANIRLGEIKPGRHGKRILIGNYKEIAYKQTVRREVKRSEKELVAFLEKSYQQILQEQITKRKKTQKEEKSSDFITAVIQRWLDEVAEFSSTRTLEAYTKAANVYIQAVKDHPIEEFKKMIFVLI